MANQDRAPRELPISRDVPLSALPSCAGGMSRRGFCLGAGAGLVTLGLSACDPGGARLGVGGIDDSTPTGNGGSNDDLGTSASHDLSSSGSAGHDLANGSHDLANGSTAHDMAQAASSCPAGTVNAGAASAIAVGSAKHLSGTGYSIFICRDAGGLYALDAACTHEGKLLTKQSTQFYCSRHGATWDLNGDNPTAPAFSPLDHYDVCVDASGNVAIDTNNVVAPSTRA